MYRLKYIDTEFKQYISKKKKLNPYNNLLYKYIQEKRIITFSVLIVLVSIFSTIFLTKIVLKSDFRSQIITSTFFVLLSTILFFMIVICISLLVDIWMSISIKTDNFEMDNLSRIDNDYQVYNDIKNNTCIESCVIFREKLKNIILKRSHYRKELKNLLPFLAILSLFGFYYFTGYDIEGLNTNISPLIGNASLFTLALSLFQLVLTPESKDIFLYSKFISILNIAIETNAFK